MGGVGFAGSGAMGGAASGVIAVRVATDIVIFHGGTTVAAGVWVVRDFVIMYPVNRATPDLVYTRSVGGGVNTPLKEGEGISTSTMKNQ